MIVKVSLHTHTDASADGSLSEAQMAAAYRRRGYVTAVTDHDSWSSPAADDRIAGIEHTIDEDRFVHVVELGDGFSFLPHPQRTFPEDTRERAAAFAYEHGLDGVEKFNRGRQNYEGHIDGVVELANDDAHNTDQIGLSHMTVDVEAPTGAAVMHEIRNGQFEVHNEPSNFRTIAGGLRQGLAMGTGKAFW